MTYNVFGGTLNPTLLLLLLLSVIALTLLEEAKAESCGLGLGLGLGLERFGLDNNTDFLLLMS